MRLSLAVLMLLGLAGCRLLGIDTSIPCKTKADCPASESACTNGFCTSTTGEGEGAAGEGEGEGAASEGEGEGVVAGEGEGEGVAGEGEGEGEGPAPTLDFTPTLGQPVGTTVGGRPAAVAVAVADCTGSCTEAPGPDSRPAGFVTAPSTLVVHQGGIPANGALLLEAVIDLPVTTKPFPPATAPLQLFQIVDGTGSGKAQIGAALEVDPDASVADLDLAVRFDDGSGTAVLARRHLGDVARGWAHLFCGVDTRSGPGFAVAQCFLNGERFAIQHTGSTFHVQSTGATTTTVAVPYAEIALWDDTAYDAIFAGAPATTDPLVAPDLLHSAARTRMAEWAGVPSTPLPPLFADGATEVEMRDNLIGPLAILGSGANDGAVTWLMPGWPRVIDDGGTAALLVEGTRTNLAGDAATPFSVSGCAAALGPSGDAKDAFLCNGGAPITNILASTFGGGTESILASAGETSATITVTFGGTCRYTLTKTTATAAGDARCTTTTLASTASSSGAKWFRLSAPGQTSMPLTTSATTLFAYPQDESGTQATSPIPPAATAPLDVLVYPLSDAFTASFDLLASLDAPKSDTEGAIAAVITDTMPTADAQLFIDGTGAGGPKITIDTSVLSSQSASFAAGDLWQVRLNPSGAACTNCTPLDLTVQNLGAPPALLFEIGGALALQNNLFGLAVQDNIYAVKRLALSIPQATGTAPPPATVDVTYAGVPAGGSLSVPSKAVFGSPVLTFDANDPSSGFTGQQGVCAAFPASAPAPTVATSKAFLPTSACKGLGDDQAVTFGTGASGAVLIDAFFQAVPSSNAQLIAGFPDKNLALEVSPVQNKFLGLRLVGNDTTFTLAPPAPSNSVGFDGWDYVACFVPAGSQNPTCTVNMQPVNVSQNGGGGQLNAQVDVIGSDGDSSAALGPIAFVHAWNVPQGFVTSGDNASSVVNRLAASVLGIEPASSIDGGTPSFARAAPATETLLSGGNYVVFDVGRDFPRTAIVDLAAPAGYLGEPDAQNHLVNSVAMTTSPWLASGTDSGSGVAGPRPGAEITSVAPGGSISQSVSLSAFSSEKIDGGHYDVVASLWVDAQSGSAPTLELDFGGTIVTANITANPCAQAAGVTATCTLTSTDGNGWQHVSLATQVGTTQASVTYKVGNSGSASAFVTAPQLEVGLFSTSYQPTSSTTNAVRRPPDDLEYTLLGPAGIAGTFDITASVPDGLPATQSAVLAAVVEIGNALRPMFDWHNDKVSFPDFRKASADPIDTTVGKAVSLHTEWRHGTSLVQTVAANGTLSTATPTANASILDVPDVLVVGGLGKANSAVSCNTCSVGATVSHVNVTFTPNIP